MNQPSPATEHAQGTTLLFPFVVACWFLIVILGAWQYQGPDVVPKDGPEGRFSAERAIPILDRIVGDNRSHETGSEHHAVVRQRIVDEFKTLGLTVEEYPCVGMRSKDYLRIDLVNLLVRIPGRNHGTPDQRTIVALSHYDSRPNAAGVADDGVGVAVGIEVARMLLKEPQLNHDILFLITDGEELGLLGADAFVRGHPLADECDLVINLEARGTSGPSLMFETNPDNALAIPLFNRAANRPFCSSLFYEIYKILPRDTDFRKFREANIPGYNFAFIGNVRNYHTMNDSLQNLDRRSLQHHGDNLLGLIRELDEVTQFRPDENQNQTVVYFDFFGFFVIYWPTWLSWVLLLVDISGNGFSIWRWSRIENTQENQASDSAGTASRKRWKDLLTSRWIRGSGYLTVSLFLVYLCCTSLQLGLFSGQATQAGWVRAALLVEMAFWFISVSAMFIMCWLFDRRTIAFPLFATQIFLWSLLALVVLWVVPGASYLFLVPLLVTGIFSVFVFLFSRQNQALWVFAIFAISVAVIWLPMERMFYDAVGFKFQTVLMIRVTLVSTCLLPIVMTTRSRSLPGYAITLTVLGFLSAVLSIVWS